MVTMVTPILASNFISLVCPRRGRLGLDSMKSNLKERGLGITREAVAASAMGI